MTTTTTERATLTVGMIKLPRGSHGRTRRYPVHVLVELYDGRLSLSGDYGPENGGGGGQILSVFDDPCFASSWPHLRELREIWQRWHLNDMRPGCEHQRAAGWHERPIDPDKPLSAYGRHFDGQLSDTWNMLGWVRPDEHPDGLLGRPCPECGYGYGTAWLREELPADVVATVRGWMGRTP